LIKIFGLVEKSIGFYKETCCFKMMRFTPRINYIFKNFLGLKGNKLSQSSFGLKANRLSQSPFGLKTDKLFQNTFTTSAFSPKEQLKKVALITPNNAKTWIGTFSTSKRVKGTESVSKEMKRHSPRVDFAFKKLFGSEEGKKFLKSLINSLLPSDQQLTEITLVDPQNNREKGDDKLSILDIKAVDNLKRQYNIEMQVTDDMAFIRRSLYYLARHYSSQLKIGMPFDSLQRTIGIYILNYIQIKEEKEYHNVYRLSNRKSHKELTDLLEVHFIELEKFIETVEEPQSKLDRWTSFIATSDNYEKDTLPEFYESDMEMKEAFEVLERLNFTPEEEREYEARRKLLLDEEGAFKTAHYKGLQEGEQKKAKEIAIRMLGNPKLSIEDIMDATGLSKEEIEQLDGNRGLEAKTLKELFDDLNDKNNTQIVEGSSLN
jgi:predicted transposase/invertase (TIGR01784 family)